jgi:hypothetical protein
MAKRKAKKKDNAPMQAAPSMPERKSVETEEAENGYIVRVSHEGKQGYKTKRYVAFSHPEALRIAAQGMNSMSGKRSGKKKSGRGKKFALKKS